MSNSRCWLTERGYTHVLDTSILANRVAQLEAVLSRLLTRVDNVDAYQDLLQDWKDPLPVYKHKEEGKRERSNTLTSIKRQDPSSDDEMDGSVSGSVTASKEPQVSIALPGPSRTQTGLTPIIPPATAPSMYSANTPSTSMMNYMPDSEPWMGFNRFEGGNEPASKAPSVHEHDAALALEGMALGRELGDGIPGLPPTAAQRTNNDEPTPGSPLTFSSFIQHKRSMKDVGGLKAFPAVNRLPSIIVGKYVITHFVSTCVSTLTVA